VRGVLAAPLVACWLLITAAPAAAHGDLVAASPPSGSVLSAAPGQIRLTFGEPLNRRLSSVVVTLPDGTTRRGGPDGKRTMAVTPGTNQPGVYRVAWVSVSTFDGHPLRGEFRLGVGVAPTAGPSRSAAALSRADVVVAVARLAEYLLLLLLVGAAVLRAAAARAGVTVRTPPTVVIASAGAACGLAVVVGESVTATGSAAMTAAFLTAGAPGVARAVRLAAEAALALAAFLWPAAVPAFAVLSLTGLAAAGHAAAVRPVALGVLVDAGHLVTAGLWAGAILALATSRVPDGWRSEGGRAVLSRLPAVALPAFVVTVLTGTLRGTEELGGMSDLIHTEYGRVLAVKVLLVTAMVPLSVRAWRRQRPLPRLEAALACLVVAAAALLAAVPLPPNRAAQAEAADEQEQTQQGLPDHDDVTLAAGVGMTVVGLSLRPRLRAADPDTLLAHLIPYYAGDTPELTLTNGRAPIPLERCGAVCHSARLDLTRVRQVDITVSGRGGGAARLTLPDPYAPAGIRLLDRARTVMRALRSARTDEVLGPNSPPLRTRYDNVAPDQWRFGRLGEPPYQIYLGNRSYSRQPNGEWKSSTRAPVRWPQYAWDLPGSDVRGVHIIGSGGVDGAPTTRVGYMTASPLVAWFTLDVDRDGRVRRMHMYAQGHFMVHSYSAFDAPVAITPP